MEGQLDVQQCEWIRASYEAALCCTACRVAEM